MTTPGFSSRKTLWKVLIPIVAIVVIVIAGLLLVKSQISHAPRPTGAPEEIAAGAVLPDFTLTRFENNQAVKFSELPGKIILLNFWATWCTACLDEMPSIVKLHDLYKDKGFEVAAINVDEDRAAVPKAIQDMKLNFPIFLDPDSAMTDLFDVHAIPFTAVVDHNGKILHVETGEANWMAAPFQERLEGWLRS